MMLDEKIHTIPEPIVLQMFAIPNTKIFLDMDIPTVPENSWNF
jgi:hypothetical protein